MVRCNLDTPPFEVQPPPATGSGKFYFKSGAVYDGEWMKVPMPKLEGTDTKPVDPKAPPVEQPEATQIMRHGRGASCALIACRLPNTIK